MALSQKHRGKIFVPWFCSDEWKMVYNLIYSENSTVKDKENALNILKMWKIRTPLLFAGLEGTLTVLEVLLLDHTKLQESVVCSLYATAILRFLNICAAGRDRQGTFYQTAKKKNLPDWLINIRHDLAHSQKLPSKYMLNLSLEYCLNWLKSMYWDLQNEAIEDYVVNEPDFKSDPEDVIKVFSESTLASLSVENPVELYFKRIRRLGVNIKKNTPIRIVQKKILNSLNITEKHLTENNRIVDCVIANVFLIPESHISAGIGKRPLKEYFDVWNVLLQYLEQQDLLMKFIEKLHALTCNENIENDIKQSASLWLNEIFKNILKKQMDHSIALKKNNGEIQFHEAQNTKVRVSDTSDSLNFADYNQNLIKSLDTFKNFVLLNPNQYVEVYLRKLLLVVGCHKNFISDMTLAVNSYLHVNSNVTLCDKLYSIEDVMFEEMEIEEIESKNNDVVNCENLSNCKRWHKLEDTSLFDGYPLGILPDQCRNKNPIL